MEFFAMREKCPTPDDTSARVDALATAGKLARNVRWPSRRTEMSTTPIELPLAFDGHLARVVVTRTNTDGWHACAEVDGREIGWEHYTLWVQVERFRERMQTWLAQAERTQRPRCNCLG